MGNQRAPLESLSRRALFAVSGSFLLGIVLASCAPEPPAPDYAIELNKRIRDAGDGAVIVLPKGTRVVRSTVRLRSGVVLRGHEDGSTLRLEDQSNTPFVLGSRVEDVQIRSIRFDGGRQSSNAVSIQLDAVSRVALEKCEFVRMKHAVHIYASEGGKSKNVSVVSCSFDEITDFGVRVDPQGEDVEITGNTVSSVTKGVAPSPSAIYVRGKRVKVLKNTVLSSYDTGVMVAGDAARSVTIEENSLSTDMVSIYFGNGARTGLIQKNSVTSARDFGIHVHDRDGGVLDLEVTANTIGPTGKSGIQIEGARRVKATRNVIKSPAQREDSPKYWRCGIAVTRLKSSISDSVLIEDNDISGASAHMAFGVYLMQGARNVIVKANRIEGAQDAAYEIDQKDSGPYLVERADGSVVANKGLTQGW